MVSELKKELEKLNTEIREQKILQKEFLTFKEACQYLNVSSSYLYKKTSKREIPFYSPSRRKLFFKKDELDNWMFSDKTKSSKTIEEIASDYLLRKGRII